MILRKAGFQRFLCPSFVALFEFIDLEYVSGTYFYHIQKLLFENASIRSMTSMRATQTHSRTNPFTKLEKLPEGYSRQFNVSQLPVPLSDPRLVQFWCTDCFDTSISSCGGRWDRHAGKSPWQKQHPRTTTTATTKQGCCCQTPSSSSLPVQSCSITRCICGYSLRHCCHTAL